ncbi:MAG: adenylate/guanylate cyclase domain-containing protein [Acidimicrobiales bacterium]
MTTTNDRLSALEKELIGPARYNGAQVAEAAGTSLESARALWRAMGFPAPAATEVLFTDLDVKMLRSALELVDDGLLEYPVVIHATRAIGQALSRVAEAEVAILSEWVRARGAALSSDETNELLETAARGLLLQRDEEHITYAWRRHLVAALGREFAAGPGVDRDPALPEAGLQDPVRAVAFADLVGFSAVSQEADSKELTALIDRFEDLAYDLVAGGGGRVVKTIGDEVFFAVDDPVAAAEIALDLAEAYTDDELLPDVRVGLACGRVISRAGDLFGPAVNLASRLVNVARPGTVLVSPEIAEAVAGKDHLITKPLRRLRVLKGIGRVHVQHLYRAEAGRRT